MWKKLYEALTSLFMLTQRVDRLEKQGEAMRRDIHDLQLAVERLAHEIRHVSEHDRHEREKLVLQLENAMLRFERRLPPPKGEIDKDVDS